MHLIIEWKIMGSCLLKVERQTIPLIDTLDRHWIGTSVDTWSILHRPLGWQLVKNQLIFNWCTREMVKTWPTINRLLIECRWSVDQVSIGMLIEYQTRCQSQVSIKSINKHSTLGCFSTHGPNNDPNNKYLISHSPLELDQCTQTMINKYSSNSVKNHNWQEAEKVIWLCIDIL